MLAGFVLGLIIGKRGTQVVTKLTIKNDSLAREYRHRVCTWVEHIQKIYIEDYGILK